MTPAAPQSSRPLCRLRSLTQGEQWSGGGSREKEMEGEREEIVKQHDTAGTRRWMTGSLVAPASSHYV